MDKAFHFDGKDMRDNLIYEKTYPKDSWKQLFDMALSAMSEEKVEIPAVSGEELLDSARENISLKEIPSRRRKRAGFIEAAKALSEEYEYDIRIWESEYDVTVGLYLDLVQATSGKLSRLIGMSDDIGISIGEMNRDIAIYLKCCFFYLYYKGKLVFPKDSCE